MRSTGPSLRRRNYAQQRSNRSWLAQRDDDSDGFASGEDSGPDSDDEDALPLARPARPVTDVGQAGSSGRLGGAAGATLGAGTGGVAAGGANRVVQPVARPTQNAVVFPGSTLAAADGEESDSLSDGIESGIESAPGDELSDDEVATTAPPPPTATAPALAAPPGAVQPVLTTASTLSTLAPPSPPPPPPPPPPAATVIEAPAPVLAPANPGTTASSSSTTAIAVPSVTETASTSVGAGIQTLPPPAQPSTTAQTTLPSTSSASQPGTAEIPATSTIVPTALPTLAVPTSDLLPSSTTAFGGSAQEENGDVGNTLGPITAEEPRVNAGAAAGIVIGVLALIGFMVGAAFLWKKWRRNSDKNPALPFFGRKSENDNGPDVAYNGATMEKDTIPILPPSSLGSKKTNSEMMDQLMQATYRSENGVDNRDSLPGAVGQNANQNPYQPGFLDETAYTALAGPLTPVAAGTSNRRSKPVIQWLDNVKTPRQSGVVRWPSADAPSIPPSAPMPQQPRQQGGQPVIKPPIPQFLPPQPAFRNEARYTATTTTTTTSGSDVWYG